MKGRVTEDSPEYADWARLEPIYRAHESFLRHLGASATRSSSRLSNEDAGDLVQSFVIDVFPRLVPRLEALPLERQRAYLRVAFRNFAVDVARSQASAESALRAFAAESSQRPSNSANEMAPGLGAIRQIDAAVSSIPAELREAASSFLGLTGPAESIREIAARLRVSRYRARLLVLDGLLATAIAAGLVGRLSQREVDVCRMVLLEGAHPAEAATQLLLSGQQAKAALAHARDVITASLT